MDLMQKKAFRTEEIRDVSAEVGAGMQRMWSRDRWKGPSDERHFDAA